VLLIQPFGCKNPINDDNDDDDDDEQSPAYLRKKLDAYATGSSVSISCI